MTIFNKYKEIFDDFIDNLDIKSSNWPNSPDWLKLIKKKLYNTFKFNNGSLTLLKRIIWIKISQLRHQNQYLRFATLKYINAIMLYPLVLRVKKHNMKKVRRMERMERVKGVRKIKKMKRVKKAIRKIK